MRCEVKLYVAGKVYSEFVEARNYQEAREVAVVRNPHARVIGVNAVFGDETVSYTHLTLPTKA